MMAEPFAGSPGGLRLLDIDEDHVKGIAFNMLFLVWRFETRSNAYRRAIRLASELGARFPEGIGLCQVVEIEALPPGVETRKLFLEMWREASVKHFSVTHEGTGFKAASVRAIVSGAQAFAARKCEHAVHKTIAAAAEWHARQQARLGRNESAADIAHVITALRTRQRDQFPPTSHRT